MKIKIAFLLLVLFSVVFAQQNPPKYEMRGVWIASLGIDWPSSRGTDAATIKNQKDQLTAIFDLHKSYELNAIFFHVRPKCDAIYKSDIEPWSHYITGTQGVAPSDPNYDPMQFAIEEAHKRGMELHAWLNPYRAYASSDGFPLSLKSVVNTHPEWIIKCNGTNYMFLNPGLPEVRAYLVKVIMDIVRRYDVDGIHFDDYFYPYSEYGTFNDDATFTKYKNGFTDRSLWRENNVNVLLKMIADSINSVKPYVKFGVSPSGNPGVNGTIFCNPTDWLAGKYTDDAGVAHKTSPYIDYILPQLYWVDFNGMLPSWSGTSFLNNRHLYVGQAAYRLAESSWPVNELSRQIAKLRNTATVNGSVYFSSKNLTGNTAGSKDTLTTNYYSHPALTPKMAWKNGGVSKLKAPKNVRMEKNSLTGKYELKWDAPEGEKPFAYLVYRSDNSVMAADNANLIFGYTGETLLKSENSKYSVTKGTYYAVAAVDRYSLEGPLSASIKVDLPDEIPAAPALVSPADGDAKQLSSAQLSWSSVSKAIRYSVEISTDAAFSSLVGRGVELTGNIYKFNGIQPGKKYYWRVQAHGAGGASTYSKVYSFESILPGTPELLEPKHASTTVSQNPVFRWKKVSKATSYNFMLSKTNSFDVANMVINTNVQDTTVSASDLILNKNYFWKVQAKNDAGTSPWSDYFGFKVTVPSDVMDEKGMPKQFGLMQNYPNPFNPETQVTFTLPVTSHVTLKVYDLLGREVLEVINGLRSAGSYSVKISDLKAAGVYMYRLEAGSFVETRKMVFLK